MQLDFSEPSLEVHILGLDERGPLDYFPSQIDDHCGLISVCWTVMLFVKSQLTEEHDGKIGGEEVDEFPMALDEDA